MPQHSRSHLTLLPVLCAAIVFALPGRIAGQTLQADTRSRLDSEVAALMREGDIPGISAAIVRDGAIYWSGAFGVQNAETREPVDRYTVFDAASLTKPVVAYTVLRLADRGLIDLDTPIAQIRPNDRMRHDPRYERITPRMVLSHGTGLPNWGGDRLDLGFDPGTGWGYSGEGFVWLADALETLSGLSLEDLVRRETFEPLGMRHSTVTWVDSLESNGADRHGTWGRVVPRRRPPPELLGRANAAASLRTTAEDYSRFLVAVMHGTGLAPETARQFLAVQNEARDAANYRSRPADLRARIAWGLGWGLERIDEGVRFWHWGDNGSAKAFVTGDPRRRTAVVYFANSENGLTIAGAMTALALASPHHAVQWIDYQRFDAPARVARRAIVRTGLDSGATAAARRFREARRQRPDLVTLTMLLSSTEALGSERRVAVADTLLAIAAGDFPDSVAVPLARGDLHLNSGDPRQALPHFDRAAEHSPSDSVARHRASWTRQYLAALERPRAPGGDVLARFAGAYGPRKVTLENGGLHYQRDGGRKYALRALSADTFVLEELPTFRLQFVSDGGAATKVIGHYHDGRRDENERTTR